MIKVFAQIFKSIRRILVTLFKETLKVLKELKY